MTQTPRMIEHRMVFGVREDVRDGVHYFDDNHIVWVADKMLVLLDTQLGTQQLTPCTPSCEAVSAMAITVNRRMLAVAESGRNPAIVLYLFDPNATPKLRRKRVLQVPDLGSTNYVSMCFSVDGKQLVALGGFPEWKLTYWSIEKLKLVTTCPIADHETPCTNRQKWMQCSLCPQRRSLICVTGHGAVKFFETESCIYPAEGGLEEEGTRYLSHVWLAHGDQRLLVATDNGDLLLFEKQIYRHILPFSPSDGLSINSLLPYSKGFVCGGDLGVITVFEQTGGKEMYRKVRTFRYRLDDDENITAGAAQPAADVSVILSFTVSPLPAEEHVAFLTSTKQLCYFNLPNADFTRADETVFQPVGQPFHSGPITGVDTCAQRPLVVTAGRDRRIFIWNSLTNTVEMHKRFNSDILSVAIDPSGLHLLVGFADGLRLMSIYNTELRESINFGIRGCSACCFSSGGQYFAAMHSSTIHIYYTYTGELLGHLRGHNGKVKSLYFVPPDDTRLVSTGADGAVFEFSLSDFHKVSDHVLKAVTYHCGVSDTGTVWTAGNDRKLRQLERAKLKPLVEYDLVNASMCSMTISHTMKLLFGGCEDGTVRVFNAYLGERLGHERETATRRGIMMESHSTHSGIVSQLALSYDENLLVSVGDDGAVVFWDVVAPHRGIQKEMDYSSELLMDRRELQSMAASIAQLTDQVAELKHRMTQKQMKREQVYEEQVTKLENEYREERGRQMALIDALEAEKNEQAIRFTEYMAEAEVKGRAVMAQRAEDYAAKIDALRNRSDQLHCLIEERRREYEEKATELRNSVLAQRTAEAAARQRELQALEDEFQTFTRAREEHDAETAELGRLIEEDTDVSIIQEKERYEKQRRELEEELTALQSTNNLMLSKENLNRADLEAKKADMTEKLRQQTTLEAQIEAAKRDIEALTNELRERGDTIADKERRVNDLRKKNQELEKFKFVLEYKIKELKEQIDPRDEEIDAAKKKLTHMEGESEKYQQSNEALVMQIRNLRQKRAGQQKEVASLAKKLKAAEEYHSRLWTELSDVRLALDNPRKLKEMAKSLFDKYTSTKPVRTPKALASRTATDEVRDYHRERDHLERNLASLKKKVAKDGENNHTERNRITAENAVLIREINELRKEARALADKRGTLRRTDPSGISAYDEEVAREVEVQRSEMQRLREWASELEGQLRAKGIPLPNSSLSDER